MTTAPRRKPTLETSLNSLRQAGWEECRLFAEPETPLPTLAPGISLTQHQQTLGPFPNWYLSLTELYLRLPHAEAYLLCQDDVVFAARAREYLEQVLWPASEVGVVSLYCPSHEHSSQMTGWRQIEPGWNAWGAVAYVFSNPGLRQFLSDSIVLNHRHHGPAQGLRNIDSVVGGWCERQQLPYFVHVPSLAQHIGETSTIWSRSKANGRRKARVFLPDFPGLQLEQAAQPSS